MEVNDQLSRYQAEFYVENVHDAFVNVQRLLNDYNAKINCISDAIDEEIVYRRQSKKQRMKKAGAVILLLWGLIHILLTLVLLAATGYSAYIWYTNGTLPEFVPYPPLYVAIAGLVLYLLVLIITCKIFARRRIVGRRLNIKKARKTLTAKKERADALTNVLTSYPLVYEGIQKVLIKTKRHPLGKILISLDDKNAIDDVKSFCAHSEEATKTYNTKEN